MSAPQEGLAIAFSAVALGLFLSALDTQLYRILEGYLLWPSRLQARGVRNQQDLRREIQETAEESPLGWRQALAYERIQRFPIDEAQVAPTRFGNAIRALETYAIDRFNLDSQRLWTEIYSVVPDHLRSEYEQSRANVDFFVGLIYLSAAFGLLSLGVAVWASATMPAIVGAVMLLSLPILYRLATVSSTCWDETVRAIVNVGRAGLASSLALELPPTLVKEREMWGLVNAFLFYPHDPEWADGLDEFRVQP